MLEMSRDGRRIYVTNSLYGAWDEQFYPEGVARMGPMLDADPDGRPRSRPGFLHRPFDRRAAASDPPRRRRRVLRFVLLSVSGAWPWIAVALLGAYHGIDPSMGWLFAVALGLQDKRRGKVLWALLPIAIGHLISIALVGRADRGSRMTTACRLRSAMAARRR